MRGIFHSCGPGHWSEVRKKQSTREMPILYAVVYNSSNHWSILTQRLGSAWPDVLPFCIINVLVVLTLNAVDPAGEKYYLSVQGHKFIQFVVTFLMARFYEARGYLEELYKRIREFQYCHFYFA
jgi:hypothetical protein